MAREQCILQYDPREDSALPWQIKVRDGEDGWMIETWAISESEAMDAISENNYEIIRKIRRVP